MVTAGATAFEDRHEVMIITDGLGILSDGRRERNQQEATAGEGPRREEGREERGERRGDEGRRNAEARMSKKRTSTRERTPHPDPLPFGRGEGRSSAAAL